MFKRLFRLLPASSRKSLFELKQKYVDDYAVKAYSQEGEDMILRRIFEHKKNGFYIDIGAHHPKRFSNTYAFYKLGWHGINVDAMPGSMTLFKKVRPRDINLEIGISEKQGKLDFYCFDEPAINSFDKELSEKRINEGVYKLRSKESVNTYPLADVLNKHLPKDQEIDFMSIDVEGLDFMVLKSNDWTAYRPRYILVEAYDFSIAALQTEPAYKLLAEKGYRFYAKTVNTVFFSSVSLSD